MKQIMAMMLIAIYILPSKLMAQGFIRSYHINQTGSDNADVVIADTSGYLIQVRADCLLSPTCAGLVKTDSEGTKQWDNLFSNSNFLLNPRPTLTEMSNNNYIMSGGIGYFGYPWQLFFLKLNEIGDSLKLVEFGNLMMRDLGGAMDIKGNTIFSGISISDVDYTFSIIKLLTIDTGLINLIEVPLNEVNGGLIAVISDINVSEFEQNAYISIIHANMPSPPYYVTIRKLNLSGTTIWDYPLNTYTTYTNTPSQIVALPNGNIVTRWFDESAVGSSAVRNPYLICLNSDGEFVWRYNLNEDAYEKFPIALTLAANGDIIGCGYTQNPNYNYECGWLFRISPNGELLWEREYISHTPIVNFLVPQGIDEDPYGNIVATGAIVELLPTGGYQGNALLLKVLSNGCFTSTCNGGAEDTLIIASTVVGVDSSPKPLQPAPAVSSLVLFPNPTNGVVKILLPTQRQNAQIRFFDLSGSVLKTVPVSATYDNQYHISIDTEDLPEGVYIVSYEVEGQVFASAKLVVAK